MALVIPMALQNLINTGVSACDVFMLGKVGETALSASSLARQVQYIMSLFLFGLTSGATVLTAQYWGKGDKKNHREDTRYGNVHGSRSDCHIHTGIPSDA